MFVFDAEAELQRHRREAEDAVADVARAGPHSAARLLLFTGRLVALSPSFIALASGS